MPKTKAARGAAEKTSALFASQKKDAQTENSQTENQDDNTETNAVDLLKADHRKVEKLFKEYEKADEDDNKKSQLARQICQELIIHTKLEEEIFYPACREKGVEDDIMDEAQVEHDGAKVMIADILKGSPDDDFYDAKVSVLSEYIKHHVAEEEKMRTGVFAQAKRAGLDMDEIGKRLRARKTELTAEAQSLLSQPLEARALHLDNVQSQSQESSMPRYSNQGDRDNQGRFMSDDDDRQSSRSRGYSQSDDDHDRNRSYGQRGSSRSEYDQQSYQGNRGQDRNQQGQYMSDDDGDRSYRGSSSRSSGRQNNQYGNQYGGGRGQYEQSSYGQSQGQYGRGNQDRDEHGRFMSQDDEESRYGNQYGSQYGNQSGNRSRSSRDMDDDHDHGSNRSQRGRSQYDEDDDNDRSMRSGGGRGSSSRSSSQHSHGGWYGDEQGHSQAARRGWQNRE